MQTLREIWLFVAWLIRMVVSEKQAGRGIAFKPGVEALTERVTPTVTGYGTTETLNASASGAAQVLNVQGHGELIALSGSNPGFAEVRITDRAGSTLFVFPEPDYARSSVATGDIDGDGRHDDFVMGMAIGTGGAKVKAYVWNETTQSFVFASQLKPFGPGFQGSIYPSLGDVTGDGKDDLAVARGNGPGQRATIVKAFDLSSSTQMARFEAFPGAPQGAQCAFTGDVNGDGTPDLAVAAASGRQRVKIIDGHGLQYNKAATVSAFRVLPTDVRVGFVLGAGTFGPDGDVILASPHDGSGRVLVFTPFGGNLGGITLPTIPGSNRGLWASVDSSSNGEPHAILTVPYTTGPVRRTEVFGPQLPVPPVPPVTGPLVRVTGTNPDAHAGLPVNSGDFPIYTMDVDVLDTGAVAGPVTFYMDGAAPGVTFNAVLANGAGVIVASDEDDTTDGILEFVFSGLPLQSDGYRFTLHASAGRDALPGTSFRIAASRLAFSGNVVLDGNLQRIVDVGGGSPPAHGPFIRVTGTNPEANAALPVNGGDVPLYSMDLAVLDAGAVAGKTTFYMDGSATGVTFNAVLKNDAGVLVASDEDDTADGLLEFDFGGVQLASDGYKFEMLGSARGTAVAGSSFRVAVTRLSYNAEVSLDGNLQRIVDVGGSPPVVPPTTDRPIIVTGTNSGNDVALPVGAGDTLVYTMDIDVLNGGTAGIVSYFMEGSATGVTFNAILSNDAGVIVASDEDDTGDGLLAFDFGGVNLNADGYDFKLYASAVSGVGNAFRIAVIDVGFGTSTTFGGNLQQVVQLI